MDGAPIFSAVSRTEHMPSEGEGYQNSSFPVGHSAAMVIGLLLASTWLVGWGRPDWMPLWPSVVALATVVLSRRALLGLVAGAAAGALLLVNGNPVRALAGFFADHLIPSLQSDWRISVILFTFLLGGFAALLEHGGGFRSLLKYWLRDANHPTRRFQWGVFGLGLMCFFDGLANSMVVGRTMRPLADRMGVSREKLAYIVDSTSSPVACVAVVSTWIAYQLSMIEEAHRAVGKEVASYGLFLKSLPYNFYCWFSLALVFIVIWRGWNFGPMVQAERRMVPAVPNPLREEAEGDARAWAAVLPVVFLLGSLLAGLYWSGSGAAWPGSWREIAEAFGQANAALVLVLTSVVSCGVAFALNRRPRGGVTAGAAFQRGITHLFFPVVILVAAWTLSSTLRELGAAAYIAEHLNGNVPPHLFPAITFLLGMAISFSTGTSWGTMGILTPLALPVALTVAATANSPETIVAATVAAIFGGAVFGDHCSPLSDTTIVSSISCGVEPIEHVRTQLPYALTAAALALVLGYGGFALSLPAWVLLPLGILVLAGLSRPICQIDFR